MSMKALALLKDLAQLHRLEARDALEEGRLAVAKLDPRSARIFYAQCQERAQHLIRIADSIGVTAGRIYRKRQALLGTLRGNRR